jgi:hypothetical protein
MKPLPPTLHAAHDWTAAAGELAELRRLTGSALLAYCAESADNSREHAAHPLDAVTAGELEDLHDWLAENEPDSDPSPFCRCGTCTPGAVTCVSTD